MILMSLSSVVGDDVSHRYLDRVTRAVWRGYEHCAITVKETPVANLSPVAHSVGANRLAFASTLLDRFHEAHLQPYEPVVLRAGGIVKLVCPPLVEASRSGSYIMDGMHRVMAARQSQLDTITVTTASADVFPALPTKPPRWSAVEVRTRPRPLNEILPSYCDRNLRPTAAYFASAAFDYESLEALVAACESVAARKG